MTPSEAGTPKVSVIMPVYNGGQFFERAVQSALNQTYRNIEILIINDGSTDAGFTDSLGRQLQNANPGKIRYIKQENAGVAGALNTGIENMKGDFFCWLSHDDLYLPQKIERQLAIMERCQSRDVLLYGDWEYIGPDDDVLYPVVLDSPDQQGPSIAPVLGGAINGCTVMIPRHLLDRRRFDVRYRHTQDYRLWFELSKDVIFLRHTETHVRQRLHPGQDSVRLKDISIAEGESLWRDMVFGTSRVLRAAMDGSDFLYFRRMASRLAQMPYPEIAAEVAAAAESALDQIRITLIVVSEAKTPTSDQLEQLCCLAGSSDLQILLVGNMEGTASQSEGVQVVPDFRQALSASTGDYVAFGNFEQLPLPTTLRRQAITMSEYGRLVSLRDNQSSEADHDARKIMINDTIVLWKIMIHRYLIASGEFTAYDMDEKLSSSCTRVLATRDFVRLGTTLGVVS